MTYKNESGITPTGHHVLIFPDEVKEKTAGGIHLAPQTRDDEQRASTRGILVAVGSTAWLEFADGDPWAKPGDYVSYARFGGIIMPGMDRKDYVLLNDQDVLALLTRADEQSEGVEPEIGGNAYARKSVA